MKKIVFMVLACAAAVLGYNNTGTEDLPEMRLSYDARAIGMGEALTAMAEGVYGLAWNPAGMAELNKPELLISYRNFPLGVNGGIPAYVRKYSGTMSIGVAAQYLNYGTFPNIDEGNNDLGTSFAPYSFMGIAGFGMKINKKFSAGLTLKGIYRKLYDDYTTKGLGVDMGVRYLPDFRRISMGFVLQNIGGESATRDFSLPAMMRAGISDIFGNFPRTRFALDLAMPMNLNDGARIFYEGLSELRFGFEFRQSKTLFLRGGYTITEPELERLAKKIIQRKSYDEGPERAQSWSLGAGYKAPRFTLDYAIQSWGMLGFTHAVSVLFYP